MKKWVITTLLVIICLFSFAACGASETPAVSEELELTDEQRQQWYDSASQFVLAMNEAVQTGQAQAQMDDPVYGPAFSGWENALRDIGEVQDIEGKNCTFTKKDGTVTVTVKGSRHDADVVFTMESSDQAYVVTAITTNVEYSMNEKIEQAGLNTLLGMGTTFAILILLALVIAVFGAIMKNAGKKAKTTGQARPVPEPSVTPAASESHEERGVVETTAGTPDDDELIAVIAAAVAAAESNETLTAVIAAAVAAYEEDGGAEKVYKVDEYVARTIRKARRK